MKIVGSDSGFFKKDRVGSTGKSGKTESSSSVSSSAKSADESTGSSEKVAVSSLGKEIAKIHAAVKSSPDIRTERVAELKDQIEKGEYFVPAEEIAGKIVDDIMKTG